MSKSAARATPPLVGIAATAVLLAGYLTSLDVLLGGLTSGAHLGSPTIGAPLFLVDAAGFAAYLVLLVSSALVIQVVVSRLACLEADALWRLSFAAPLVAVCLLFVRLSVGDGSYKAGEEGGHLVTAVLAAAVLLPIPFLGQLGKRILVGPGVAALSGMALPAGVAFTAVVVGSLLPDSGPRKARLIGIAITVAWVGALVLLALVRSRRQQQTPAPARARARRWAAAALIWGVPAVAWSGHLLANQGPRGGSGPSIVFVTFDAMRADRLSLYGGRVPAPSFEALAAEGVTFAQARSQAPHTVASMTSMFSSLYPSQLPHSQRRLNPARGRMIPEAQMTLAEALSGKGYATGAITANWTLGPHTGVLRGFSERVIIDHDWRRRNLFSQVLPGLEAMAQSVVRRPERECLMDSSEVVLRYAHDFVARHRDGPFLLWLHFMNPHDPYAPPEKFRRLLLRSSGPWPIFAPHDESMGTPTVTEIRSGIVFLDEPTRRYISDLYDSEVAHADDDLGRVRSMIQKAQVRDPVIWCVGADHGQEFWNHGGYYHGHTLYDELIHVPLLISAPGGRRGLRVSEPVAMLDVMPTLFGLAGASTPASYVGRSLADTVMRGTAVSPRPVFSDSNIYYEPAETVVADGYKLVRHLVSRRLELYDLRGDPQQLHDMAEARPDMARRLTGLLDEWRARSVPVGGPTSTENEAENTSRLKALGYL